MTPQEAVDTLRAAKLYVRGVGDHGEIVGGSCVDISGGIRVVQDAFMLSPEPDGYKVEYLNSFDEHKLPLEDAVALVIRTIKPGKNIEPEPKGPGEGPVYY